MIRKFAAVLGLTLLMGAKGYAQNPPADQTSAGQQPATGQETPEEAPSRRKARPHDYLNWQFNVGGGANLPSGTTRTFVKGGGGAASVGVARNANKYVGLRADFYWANLPLRDSALALAQAPGATDHVYALTLDPIFNIPVTSKYSGYFMIGPGFQHRSGKLDSSTTVPGSPCNTFWDWWGRCFASSVPLNGNFLTSSQNEFGFNFGGGVARKVRGNLEVYVDFRYIHGSHNKITTDVRPVTIGIRW